MDRRSFFKFLGIGAATAVVAPKLPAGPQLVEYGMGPVTLPPLKTYKMLFPETVRIPEEEWKYLEHLKNLQRRALGIADLKTLSRLKRNG